MIVEDLFPQSPLEPTQGSLTSSSWNFTDANEENDAESWTFDVNWFY